MLTLVATVGALVAPTVLVHPGGAAARPAGVVWRPCPEDPTAQCGTITVPVDWSRPYGGTVDVALARRRATDPAARIGSLLVNPGGPGGSGVDFALFGADYFSPEVTRRFDLVGFDPRGVGRSHPVRCSLDLLFQAPSPDLRSQADFTAMVRYNRRLGADCRRHTGPLFDHVDTLSTVRDLDAIRAALGERALTYYGISYGTLIGQQYAQLFPHRVRALALDSNMDHSLGTRDFLRTTTITAQDSFTEFVKGCQRDRRCALAGRDIRALWHDLLRRADRGQLKNPFDPSYLVTSWDLINTAFAAGYGPDWFALAELLVWVDTGRVPGPTAGERTRALARRMLVRPGPPAAAAAPRPSAPTGPAPVSRSAEPDLVENAFPAVFCSDWRLPARDYREYAGYQREMARLAPDVRYTAIGVASFAACLGWPARVANPQRPLVPRGDAPLLLANTEHDPATGILWARNAARQLRGQATLLTYRGWGHGAYGRGRCVTGAVDRYLVSRRTPPPGTRCPAIPPEPHESVSARGVAPGGPPRWPVGPRRGVPGFAGPAGAGR
ncbi:MAG TPA: alpha/beta hydrolase [Pilimelia sp.]|nr:alpha/beta hydrolase [Pilimelia sp.]